jgi:biotin-(acetyl-CoA carboxylase) ligase
MLLEATQTQGGGFACVIGVGVNCASYPQGLPYPATDLASLGVAIAAADLLDSFAEELALKVNKTTCFNSPVLFCACVVKKLVANSTNKINFFIFD